MIIDCVSDIHGYLPPLEGGDLLIVAGDLVERSVKDDYYDFWAHLCYQNYEKIIVVSGNHDSFLQENPDFFLDCGDQIVYLCDSGTEFRGLKIWGSPWTKRFPGMNPNCMAFTVDTDEQLAEKWAMIPHDVDILVTHCPPHGILDRVECTEKRLIKRLGSPSLLQILYEQKIKPKLHVFGHIHQSSGRSPVSLDIPWTQFVNASIMNEVYDPVNKPIRVEI
jgi:Icc-related predicted phosphoesterase